MEFKKGAQYIGRIYYTTAGWMIVKEDNRYHVYRQVTTEIETEPGFAFWNMLERNYRLEWSGEKLLRDAKQYIVDMVTMEAAEVAAKEDEVTVDVEQVEAVREALAAGNFKKAGELRAAAFEKWLDVVEERSNAKGTYETLEAMTDVAEEILGEVVVGLDWGHWSEMESEEEAVIAIEELEVSVVRVKKEGDPALVARVVGTDGKEREIKFVGSYYYTRVVKNGKLYGATNGTYSLNEKLLPGVAAQLKALFFQNLAAECKAHIENVKAAYKGNGWGTRPNLELLAEVTAYLEAQQAQVKGVAL